MSWGDWGLIREAGANGDTPPLTMEPFDTGWSNGIMARHADDGRPVGHLHWHPNGEIDTVHVHPDFQRMGIGSAMLKHAKSDPVTYESTYPIRHSNNLSAAGRAWANADPDYYDPGDAHVTPAADDVKDWGWTAMGPEGHVPAHVPYTGQNEERMSNYTYPDAPDKRQFLGFIDGAWPKRWKGQHADMPWRNEWSPNHPQHDAETAPWRTAARTATQQPPPDLTFEHKPLSGVTYAHLPDQKNVGRLMYWHPGMWKGDPTGDPDPIHEPNSVMQIDVHPDHRRKGIASALFDWTKANVNPDLIHSHEVTDDGAAWSQSMGHEPNTDERLPRYA